MIADACCGWQAWGWRRADWGWASDFPQTSAAGGKPTNLTADQALAALKDGNARYVSDPQVCQTEGCPSSAPVLPGIKRPGP